MTDKEFKTNMIKKASSDLLAEFLGKDFIGMTDKELIQAIDETFIQMPDDELKRFEKMLIKDMKTHGQEWE